MQHSLEIMPLAQTRKEVNAEPDIVARVLQEQYQEIQRIARWLVNQGVRQVAVIGSGDSGFAGLCARLAFEQYAGLPCEVLQAYEFAVYGHPGIGKQSCAIVISSSGRKSTTVDALERALTSGASVIGITDNLDQANPFISRPHQALMPGALKLGWPTQTTVTTVAVLCALAVELGRANGHVAGRQPDMLQEELFLMPQKMQSVLGQCRGMAEQLAASYGEARMWTFIGSGPNLGVAWIGTALMAEGPQRMGLALSVEEFHHSLRAYTLDQDDPVVLLGSNATALQRNIDTCQAVRTRGAGLIAIIDEHSQPIAQMANMVFHLPAAPEPFSPLLTVLPLHELSIQLALQRTGNGYQRPCSV